MSQPKHNWSHSSTSVIWSEIWTQEWPGTIKIIFLKLQKCDKRQNITFNWHCHPSKNTCHRLLFYVYICHFKQLLWSYLLQKLDKVEAGIIQGCGLKIYNILYQLSVHFTVYWMTRDHKNQNCIKKFHSQYHSLFIIFNSNISHLIHKNNIHINKRYGKYPHCLL